MSASFSLKYFDFRCALSISILLFYIVVCSNTFAQGQLCSGVLGDPIILRILVLVQTNIIQQVLRSLDSVIHILKNLMEKRQMMECLVSKIV